MNLTNTELTWRVGRDCYGLELLTMKQRNEIHNLKTKGYTLENVTPSGVALMTIHGNGGYTDASVFPDGAAKLTHFDKN